MTSTMQWNEIRPLIEGGARPTRVQKLWDETPNSTIAEADIVLSDGASVTFSVTEFAAQKLIAQLSV